MIYDIYIMHHISDCMYIYIYLCIEQNIHYNIEAKCIHVP